MSPSPTKRRAPDPGASNAGAPEPGRARVASYRVQLRNGVTLETLVESTVLDNLAELGISHVYLSPVLEATPGSSHGYDVVDPSRVDPALGGDEALSRLAVAAGERGLGLLIDVVPNHMAADQVHNRWWWDVLANGPSSRHAEAFDIDWDGPEERLRGRILLPVLPDHLGREIERGAFDLEIRDGGIVLRHEAVTVPIEARSGAAFLAEAAERSADPSLRSIAERMGRLPAWDAAEQTAVAWRREILPGLQDEFASLTTRRARTGLVDTAVSEVVAAVLAELAADPDRLDELLLDQPYRLARWRSGLRDLPYRRFFDVNELIALRVDRPGVFEATHRAISAWARNGIADGVRVDHPDGLRDPAEYLGRLRDMFPDGWLLVEKILEAHEDLQRWPVDGTTGYEVGDLIARLHLDDAGRPELTSYAAGLTDRSLDVDVEVVASTRQVLEQILAADLNRLTETLLRVCEGRRRFRDFNRHELYGCLLEMIAQFPVYRIYTGAGRGAEPAELESVNTAAARAMGERPELDPELFGLVVSLLCSDTVTDEVELDFRARFHQLSGPAKAKGQEDTAWYRIITLLHRCEVGADADAWGLSIEEFHDAMVARQQRWPQAMTALTTHDSKRSEDVRARLAVLTEIAGDWTDAVTRWREYLAQPDRVAAPDAATEYYLLQTLVGAHPLDHERAVTHIHKAVREAKLHTSWIDPDAAYDAHLELYLDRVLADAWLADELRQFDRRIRRSARLVSLSQKALQLTVPGVPDLYQECERWYLRLVDPDNRTPLDADALHRAVEASALDLDPDLDEDDVGVAKVRLVQALLGLRRRRIDAFGPAGTYEALWASGPRADHAVSFSRGGEVVVVAVRHVQGVVDGWGGTQLTLPEGEWSDVLRAGRRWQGEVSLDDLLGHDSVAVLERLEPADDVGAEGAS